MCLAIPVCVTECADGMATVRVGEGETVMNVSTLLLEEPPCVGDYAIVHAGFILRILDPAEARESLAIFRELASLTPENETA